MTFEEWERTVSGAITGDILWKVRAYRLALFAADLGWEDVSRLAQDHRTRALSDQLYRALGSVSANIAEGYSRSGGRDRARFYEFALGSARETRDWYHKGRHILGDAVTEHRVNLQTEIIRLLLTMIPDQRTQTLREPREPYSPNEAPAS
ncbi:MAG TPA: four helix bundle protein [Anaerolineae bacterium]|nr:four helix bundle protein [Anaerolineae bacterium]